MTVRLFLKNKIYIYNIKKNDVILFQKTACAFMGFLLSSVPNTGKWQHVQY